MRYLWAIVFGIGLGAVLGLGIGVGVGIDPANVSRFIGAMLGSLIAVSGAVSLHFLKEHQDSKKVREHLARLLDASDAFAEEAERQLETRDSSETVLLTFQHQFSRLARFCEKYEGEDMEVSEAHLSISLRSLNESDYDLTGLNSQEAVELTRKYIRSRKRLIDMARNNIRKSRKGEFDAPRSS